ncbi:MAG: hypothetical protein ACP5QA_14595, partial [Phycisphaerae bacterium]
WDILQLSCQLDRRQIFFEIRPTMATVNLMNRILTAKKAGLFALLLDSLAYRTPSAPENTRVPEAGLPMC